MIGAANTRSVRISTFVAVIIVIAFSAFAEDLSTEAMGQPSLTIEDSVDQTAVAEEEMEVEAPPELTQPKKETITEEEFLKLPGVLPTDLSQYTLGVADVIEVNVLRHPEVSGQYIINNEGKIQYEFVGDVKVEGLKKDEVKDVLMNLLSTYIISPSVTVKITGYNSKIVYVIGEVAVPGKIFMRGDTITVRDALIHAGLPLLTAATKKAKVITPSETGDAAQAKVNIYALLYEGDLRENLVMKPGDTLYVPATIMAKAMRVISPVAAPIGTAAGTGRTVTTGF